MVSCILTRKQRRTHAQIWSFDLIVALVVFVLGLFVLYYYGLNYKSSAFDELGQLYYDADLASSVILSDSAEGLSTGGHLNQTKLELFDSLTPEEKKIRFGVSHNFYFSFPELSINGSLKERVGIINTSDVNSLVHVSRVTIYHNKPVTLEVVAWR